MQHIEFTFNDFLFLTHYSLTHISVHMRTRMHTHTHTQRCKLYMLLLPVKCPTISEHSQWEAMGASRTTDDYRTTDLSYIGFCVVA